MKEYGRGCIVAQYNTEVPQMLPKKKDSSSSKLKSKGVILFLIGSKKHKMRPDCICSRIKSKK